MSRMGIKPTELPRRTFFNKVRRLSLIVVGAINVGLPSRIFAGQSVQATSIQAHPVEMLIKATMGDGPITFQDDLAYVAEKADNGAMVVVMVNAKLPPLSLNPRNHSNDLLGDQPGDYVRSVAIFVDNNPDPFTAKYEFTPETGAARLDMRIKLYQPSPVRVIAKTSRGKLYGYIQSVEVVPGQCES